MDYKSFKGLDDLTEEGRVKALFSVFGIVDRDGDVVEASSFKDGQVVDMTWHHDWKDKGPIGEGVIRVTPEGAIFDGQFWLDDEDGLKAYKKVKRRGDRQEWSWGFNVTDHAYEKRDGKSVRVIKGTEVFEVSPVFVGANQMSTTLAIKSAGETKDVFIGALPGSYEERIEQLNRVLRAAAEGETPFDRRGYAYVVATFEDHAIACYYPEGYDRSAVYYRVPYTVADGTLTIGDVVIVQPTFVPIPSPETVAGQADLVNYRAAELVRNTKGLHERRAKEGRVLSERNRTALAKARDAMQAAVGEVDALLAMSEPQPAKAASDEQPPDSIGLLLQYQRMKVAQQARLLSLR